VSVSVLLVATESVPLEKENAIAWKVIVIVPGSGAPGGTVCEWVIEPLAGTIPKKWTKKGVPRQRFSPPPNGRFVDPGFGPPARRTRDPAGAVTVRTMVSFGWTGASGVIVRPSGPGVHGGGGGGATNVTESVPLVSTTAPVGLIAIVTAWKLSEEPTGAFGGVGIWTVLVPEGGIQPIGTTAKGELRQIVVPESGPGPESVVAPAFGPLKTRTPAPGVPVTLTVTGAPAGTGVSGVTDRTTAPIVHPCPRADEGSREAATANRRGVVIRIAGSSSAGGRAASGRDSGWGSRG
jgi:hypothetical protein